MAIYKKPRGTEDLFFENSEQMTILQMIIRDTLKLYNYKEIITPIFEEQCLFERSVGENTDVVSKEMFQLNSRGEQQYVLRPEGTASIVRAVLEHNLHNKYSLPLKQFYIGPMFRYERPQRGRLRQFTQLGVEVMGVDNIDLDIETILAAHQLFTSFGLDNVVLKINSIGNPETRQKYISVLRKHLVKMDLCADCDVRIQKNILRVLDCKVDNAQFQDLPAIYDYLPVEEQERFQRIENTLKNMDIKYEIDSKLVRGLDYYTDFIFEHEFTTPDDKKIILGGGGKYRQLFSQLSDNKVDLPAIGFAFGLERILLALEESSINFTGQNKVDVFVITLNEKVKSFAAQIIFALRHSNFIVETDYSNKNLKKQFRLADALASHFSIILGDNEIATKTLTIKNNVSKVEDKVAIGQLIEYLEKHKGE